MVSNKALRQALYLKLNVSAVTTLLGSGSAGLVYAVSPPSATYPICVFTQQSSVSRHSMKAQAFDSSTWMVKGVVRSTTPSAAEDIDAAARTLLDHSSLTITGGTALYLARQTGLSYVEVDGDQMYQHVGGLYRLVAS